MKRITSIVLFLLFLFNVGGYYVVFWVLQLHADKQINYRLDSNQYDLDQTIELKIPVTLPYPIYTHGFERVNGRFEHQGEFFRLVKHKFQNDTLYIVCIRDHETRELINTMDDYVQLTQALPAKNSKAWNFISKLIKDYFSLGGATIVRQNGLSIPLSFGEPHEFFPEPAIVTSSPPPKV